MKLKLLGCLLVLALLLPSPAIAQNNWVIEGDKVFIDDANVYLSATPHTLGSSGWVEFELLSKNYEGEIDAVWGFGQDVKPSKPQIWAKDVPHTKYRSVEVNLSTQVTVDNITSYQVLPLGSAEPDIGNLNNTKLIELTTVTANDSPVGKTPFILAFNSYVQHSPTSATFDYNYTSTEQEGYIDYYDDWKPFNASLTKVNFNYMGCNEWSFTKLDASIEKNVTYKVRCWVEVPFSGNSRSSGKYIWGVKPAGETITQAKDNGHLYLLDPWYDSQWLYKRKVIFDNSASTENLTNQEVFVSINSTDFDWIQFQADGDDIRFRNSADNATLDYFAESWSYANEQAIFRVEVPQIDATSTTDFIWLYWGNNNAANGENMEGVFTADVKLASTYKDSSAAVMNDATSNDNDGTITGDTYWDQLPSGLPYLYFDGVDDSVQKASAVGLAQDADPFSVEVWYRTDFVGSTDWWFVNWGTMSTDDAVLFIQSSTKIRFAFYGSDLDTGAILAANTWYHLLFTYDGTTRSIYVNGAFNNSSTHTPTLAGTNLGIGSRYGGVSNEIRGSIAPVRIYSESLSAEEVEAHYLIERHLFGIAGEFITFGAIEGYPRAPDNFTLTAVDNYAVATSWEFEDYTTNATLMRKLGGYSANTSDGEVVYSGTLTAFTDTANEIGLELDKYVYYYRVWGVNEFGLSTAPASATIGGEVMETIGTNLGILGTNLGSISSALSTFLVGALPLLEDIVQFVIVASVIALAFWRRDSIFLHLLAVPVALMYGLTLATDSTNGSVLWVTGLIITVIGIVCLFKVATLSHSKARSRG